MARREAGLAGRWVVLAVMLAWLWPLAVDAARAQTTLRVYAGNYPKIDTLRSLANAYQQGQAGLTIEIDPGGTTPEAQQQSLNALLASRDASVDLVMLDVLRPAQWVQAQWLEPLDPAFGAERDAFLERLFPAYRQAGLLGGRLMALPLSADALMLMYRQDLLEKHGVTVPATTQALRDAAQRIVEAEKVAALRGIDVPGAPVESSVCTFLTSLWGVGKELITEGKPSLVSDQGRKALQGLASLKEGRIGVPLPGEGHPERIRQALQAGNLVFGLGWSYAIQRMQTDADSVVAGKVRLAPIPGETADYPSSCAGGWMVGVTAFSGRKAEAFRFIRYLASPEAARLQAELGDLPVQTAPYADAALASQRPLLAQLAPVLAVARLRPQTARYSEVSEIIRTNLSAFLAGSRTADAALQDMQARLSLIFR